MLFAKIANFSLSVGVEEKDVVSLWSDLSRRLRLWVHEVVFR